MPPRKRYCLTFPRSLQFVNFCLQAFHLLLKSLNRSQCLSQLLLQLGDPLVFWVGGHVPLPSLAHHSHLTSTLLAQELFNL